MILAAALAATTPSVTALRDHRRVLIVAAPSAGDPRRKRQIEALHDVAPQLEERDVTVVDVATERTRGASDSAASLRRRWKLPAARFTVLLIGKDGRKALRRATPIDATILLAAIDAMPMRRAGLR